MKKEKPDSHLSLTQSKYDDDGDNGSGSIVVTSNGCKTIRTIVRGCQHRKLIEWYILNVRLAFSILVCLFLGFLLHVCVTLDECGNRAS